MSRRKFDEFCVLLINGLSGSGKTTFEDIVEELGMEYDVETCKYSVVEPIKGCLVGNPVIGCDEHDERTREFIASCYESDKPYYLRLLVERIIMAANDPMDTYSCKKLLMVDMRERQDMLKIKNVCRNLRIQCYMVWIERPGRANDILDCDNFTYPQVDVELATWRKINDNLEWWYNIIVENNGTFMKLYKMAEKLLTCFDEGTLKDVLYLGYDAEPCKESCGDDKLRRLEGPGRAADEHVDFRVREPRKDDKFKPGDQVIVRKPDYPDKYAGGWIPAMNEYVGQVYTVSGYFRGENNIHEIALKDEIWSFDDRYLDLVTEDNVDTSDSESASASLCEIAKALSDYFASIFAPVDEEEKGD